MKFVPIEAKKISEGNIFERQLAQISQKVRRISSETNPKLRLECMAEIVPDKNSPFPENKREPLIIILLGPPGCGKGTHSPDLSRHLKIPHLSTGNLLRDNIRAQTLTGKIAKQFIDEGNLVPDEVVLDMLFTRLSQPDCRYGAILDGFPRTIPQAMALDRQFAVSAKFAVLLFNIDSKILIERICGRIACKQCGKPYHKKYDPPRHFDLCDSCKGPLYQRADDTEEVLQKRLGVYRESTEPLIAYYRAQPDVLHEINGNQPKAEVFDEITKALSIEQSFVLT